MILYDANCHQTTWCVTVNRHEQQRPFTLPIMHRPQRLERSRYSTRCNYYGGAIAVWICLHADLCQSEGPLLICYMLRCAPQRCHERDFTIRSIQRKQRWQESEWKARSIYGFFARHDSAYTRLVLISCSGVSSLMYHLTTSSRNYYCLLKTATCCRALISPWPTTTAAAAAVHTEHTQTCYYNTLRLKHQDCLSSSQALSRCLYSIKTAVRV